MVYGLITINSKRSDIPVLSIFLASMHRLIISYDTELRYIFNFSALTLYAIPSKREKKSSKVKWSYIPYGNNMGYKTIIYECKNGEVTKTVADKQNSMGVQNEPAVLLTGY